MHTGKILNALRGTVKRGGKHQSTTSKLIKANKAKVIVNLPKIE